jgi:Zn-dependent peptidase ImmA (M78 family)
MDSYSNDADAVHIGYCRDAARSVAQRHRATEPPVDIRAVAAAEGIVIVATELGSLDARLRQDASGNWMVELNPIFPETAKRFSIAHEVGHRVLAHPGCGTNPRHEREANVFAAELLMPLFMLKAALKRSTRLGQLARSFGVSREAMRIKLDEQHLLLKLTSFD